MGSKSTRSYGCRYGSSCRHREPVTSCYRAIFRRQDVAVPAYAYQQGVSLSVEPVGVYKPHPKVYQLPYQWRLTRFLCTSILNLKRNARYRAAC